MKKVHGRKFLAIAVAEGVRAHAWSPLALRTPWALALGSWLGFTAVPASAQETVASCLNPATASGQVRADGTVAIVGSGMVATTIANAPAYYAANNGRIEVVGAVQLLSSGANTATACLSSGGEVNVQSPGVVVSRLGAGGPAVRAEANTIVTTSATHFYSAQANSDGLQAVNALYQGSGDLIAIGIVLDTNPASPTYGLPVDALGNATNDPAQFVSRAAGGSHGINASGSQITVNATAPTDSPPLSSIYMFGTGASPANPSYGINALGGSTVTANALEIIARNNYNGGIRIGATSRLAGSGLDISTAGTSGFGLVSHEGATAEVDASMVRTTGIGAHGMLAQTGGSITVEGSQVVVAGSNAHALRADGLLSQATATGVVLSAMSNGGIGGAAANGARLNVAASQLYPSGIAGGNSANGLHASLGGTLWSDGNTIAAGALLGTDPSLPTYGLPVDANGVAVTDPRDFVARGNTGANGIAVASTGGTAWVNVDAATGAPTGNRSRIDLLSVSSSGILVQQAAGATSRATVANVDVYARELNAFGFQVQGTAGSTGPIASFQGISARTLGINGHGLFARDGATVSVADSTFLTAGNGVGIRADAGDTQVDATRMYIGTTGVGSNAVNAIGATIDITDSTLITTARHGMTLSALGGVTGTLISDNVDIATGVLMGTDINADTFGRPVDANGAAVSDPESYVASGLSGHGVFVVTGGGNVWMNVDPSTGAPTGSNSRIQLLGANSEGFDIQGEGTQATLANVAIQNSGNDGAGLRSNGGARITASSVDIALTGAGSYGLAAFANGDTQATATTIETHGPGSFGLIAYNTNALTRLSGNSSVATTGEGAHGAVAWSAGTVEITDSTISTSGDNAAALFVFGEAASASMQGIRTTIASSRGPGIAGIGAGTVTLVDSTVSGNGTWLLAGTPIAGLAAPAPIAPDLPEPPDPDPTVPPVTLEPIYVRAGSPLPTVMDVTATRSELTGAAITLPGSEANVLLIDSRWNLTGSSNLTNLINDPSIIDFSAPQAGVFKTLTVVNYSGDGTIALNTILGDDASPSDRLVIDGGTASGPSVLTIKQAGGGGALTVANGILVVDAINGATTTPDAFSLGGRVVAGPYEYGLQRASLDASAPQSWFLRSTIDCSAPGAPIPPCPAPPTPPSPPVPNYRGEVSLYAAAVPTAMHYGRSLLDTLHERVGEQNPLRARPDLGDGRVDGVWGRLMYVDGERDSERGIYGEGPSYDYSLGAVQIGADLYRHEEPGGRRDHVGLYGAIGYAETDVDHFTGASAGDDRVDGYTLGGYWTRYDATNDATSRSEWYLDTVLQATRYEVSANPANALPRLETEGWGLAASLEGGYPFHPGSGWRLEPQGQVIYQRFDFDDASDVAATVRFDDATSLVGRAGARLSREWIHRDDAEHPLSSSGWGRINVWHEFEGEPITEFSSDDGYIPFTADLGGSWWELELGLTREIDRNVFLYGNLGYSQGFDDDRRAWEGKIGMRANW